MTREDAAEKLAMAANQVIRHYDGTRGANPIYASTRRFHETQIPNAINELRAALREYDKWFQAE